MTVADRLARLQQQGVLPPGSSAQLQPDPGAASPLAEHLPGKIVSLGGSSFYVDIEYPAGKVHGHYPLRRVAEVSGAALAVAARDDEMRYFDGASAVFFDTETTGLSLGTGTYVFLIGAGWLDGDMFHVRQFFLARPGDEAALLEALASLLVDFNSVVSFNGKAFDLPILESRYLYQRRRPPLADPLHFDLLHAARRLWRRRLDSCALSALESSILGVARTRDDVPGWEIPALYFRYQRTGDGGLLEGVFYHNLIDVLSMATLATHVHWTVTCPHDSARHPMDWYSLGRLYDASGQYEAAVRCLDEAVAGGLDGDERVDALERLGAIYRRERRWPEALAIWERLADEGGDGAVPAVIEIAKYFEHVERDYAQALDAVRQAMLRVDLGTVPGGDDLRASLHHRYGRLLNRSAARQGRRHL